MIYQYNGYRFTRVYIQAETLNDAMSKENRRSIFKHKIENGWIVDFDDLRNLYNSLFENWYDEKYWSPFNGCSDTVFMDEAY